MISPEEYYTMNDHPSPRLKRQIWRNIKQRLDSSAKYEWIGFDRRSFAYGIAATLVFAFTTVGLYTTIGALVERSKPQTIKLDSAYESAIQQFERVLPVANKPEPTNQVSSRSDQLKLLNSAILELKKETNGNDLSPMKRNRLRQLYSMKLQLLQEMIEQGEIEL